MLKFITEKMRLIALYINVVRDAIAAYRYKMLAKLVLAQYSL